MRALRRGREKSAVLLEGARGIDEALDAAANCEFVLHSEQLDQKAQLVLARAQAAGLECLPVAAELLAEGSDLDAPTGILAVMPRPRAELDGLLARAVEQQGLVLVAAGGQDPGNVGALVRVGAGLGAVGLVFLQGSASPWHPRAVRGASGTTFRLPLVETVTAADLIAAAARQELPLWTTAADGRPYTTVAPQACVLILGEEGRGVPAELESAASERLGIPLQRGVESLNVATAAAVLVAALARPGGEA